MATVKGVNRTVADAVTAAHVLDPGLFGGNVKVQLDTYEAAAIASGTVIEVGGDLPKGARVINVMLVNDALGASVTLDVGDEEDPNRYISAYDGSAAGVKWGDLADGIEYAVDDTVPTTPDSQVLVTTGGATATGTIKVAIFYTHE